MTGMFEVIIYYNIDPTKRGLKIKIKEQNSKSEEAEAFMKQLWFTHFFLCNVTFIFFYNVILFLDY